MTSDLSLFFVFGLEEEVDERVGAAAGVEEVEGVADAIWEEEVDERVGAVVGVEGFDEAI